MDIFNYKEICQIKVALERKVEDMEKILESAREDIIETTIKMYQNNIDSAKSALEKVKKYCV